MFDIGFLELLMIAVIGLLVMGPERLPGAIRTGSLWLGRLRKSFNDIKADIEREVGADDIRQQLHNENILKDIERAKQSIDDGINSIKPDLSHFEAELNEAVGNQHEEPDTHTSQQTSSKQQHGDS